MAAGLPLSQDGLSVWGMRESGGRGGRGEADLWLWPRALASYIGGWFIKRASNVNCWSSSRIWGCQWPPGYPPLRRRRGGGGGGPGAGTSLTRSSTGRRSGCCRCGLTDTKARPRRRMHMRPLARARARARPRTHAPCGGPWCLSRGCGCVYSYIHNNTTITAPAG